MKTAGKIIVKALLALTAATATAACGKSDAESDFTTQDTNIESIVSSLSADNEGSVVEYFDGPVRVTTVSGTGEALKDGGTVSFYYGVYRISGSSLSSGDLVATNSKEYAESAGWSVSDTTLYKISTVSLSDDQLVKGLRKGLVGVKAGDQCYVLFNGRYGFGKHKVGKVPGNSALAYHLQITEVAN